MSRIRVVGGSITKTSKGATTIEVLDGNFVSIAAKQNMWNGGENGVTHHEYVAPEKKEEKPTGKYFVKGWWTDNKNKSITKAHIGDTIRFHIETKDIPDGEEITFTVYDWDGMLNPDDVLNLVVSGTNNALNKIKIAGNKGVIEWTTGAASEKLIDDEGDEIELYVKCIYKEETLELPQNTNDYLILQYTLFPLKIHQRSFAPWAKFGNMIFDKLRPNNFYGDGRSFSLKDNFLENPEDSLDERYKKLKESGNVTSRLYQKMEFDYFYNGVVKDKTIGICNMTRGQWFFLPFDLATGSKINESPTHTEYYGEHSFIDSSPEKCVINMEIEGSDPMVMPAPDIDWKLLARLTINKEQKTLNIKGVAYGKEFPAYETFIEDSRGVRFYLHTYTPLNEFELTGELLWNMPDYFGNIDITVEVDIDEKGYYFKQNLKSALYTYSELLKEDSYAEKVYKNISINDWNNMHLNKKTSKDL